MSYFKYCFGNGNLKREFDIYMKHRAGQSQATKQLTEGTSISVQEMADKMGDRLREIMVKEKETKQRKKDLRSLETEKEGIQRKLERRLAEEEGYGNLSKK